MRSERSPTTVVRLPLFCYKQCFGLDKRNEICSPRSLAANHCRKCPKNKARKIDRLCRLVDVRDRELPHVLGRPRVCWLAMSELEPPQAIPRIECAGCCPTGAFTKLVEVDVGWIETRRCLRRSAMLAQHATTGQFRRADRESILATANAPPTSPFRDHDSAHR